MLLPTTREDDLVLDPFAGSGTTGEVATQMGRRAILVESSPTCLEALNERIKRLDDHDRAKDLRPLIDNGRLRSVADFLDNPHGK